MKALVLLAALTAAAFTPESNAAGAATVSLAHAVVPVPLCSSAYWYECTPDDAGNCPCAGIDCAVQACVEVGTGTFYADTLDINVCKWNHTPGDISTCGHFHHLRQSNCQPFE